MLSIQLIKKTLLLLLYLLILLVLTGCRSPSSRFGVIFTNSSLLDIYRISDDTQGKVEQLTFTPTIGEYVLSASKNGDGIVFSTGFYDSLEMKPSELAIEKLRHVYLLETNSKKLVDITNILEDKYPQIDHEFFMDWSPDQKQFVVVNHEVAGSEIRSFLEFVDFDGKNRKEILIPTTGEMPSLIQTARWSPDGKKFLLTEGVVGVQQQLENPGAAILIYDLKSGGITQITSYKDHCMPREWSPTSQQIVATCSYVPPNNTEGVSGPETVRILDIENPGQPYERIAFSHCEEPTWSPDGKQIAFVCDKETDGKRLFIINSDGNGIHEVELENLGNPSVLTDLTWSPDGTQIVYVAGGDYKHESIYAVNIDGSNNHSLTHEQATYQNLLTYPIP